MTTGPGFWPVTLVDYAQVIGAIATAGAVIVSLWLALRAPKPRLTIDARIMSVVGGGLAEPVRVLSITVVNVGQTTAVVTNIGWEAGKGRQLMKAVQLLDDIDKDIAGSLPVALSHGERTAFSYRLDGPKMWLWSIGAVGFFPEVLKSRASLETVRAVVLTSIGQTYRCRPAASLLDAIWVEQQHYFKHHPHAA